MPHKANYMTYKKYIKPRRTKAKNTNLYVKNALAANLSAIPSRGANGVKSVIFGTFSKLTWGAYQGSNAIACGISRSFEAIVENPIKVMDITLRSTLTGLVIGLEVGCIPWMVVHDDQLKKSAMQNPDCTFRMIPIGVDMIGAPNISCPLNKTLEKSIVSDARDLAYPYAYYGTLIGGAIGIAQGFRDAVDQVIVDKQNRLQSQSMFQPAAQSEKSPQQEEKKRSTSSLRSRCN